MREYKLKPAAFYKILLSTFSLSFCLYLSSLPLLNVSSGTRLPVCVHQQTQEEEPATVLTDGQSQ